MAEICPVLPVTLLLYLFWLPSDTRGGSAITDSGSGDLDVETTPEDAAQAEAEGGAAAGDFVAEENHAAEAEGGAAAGDFVAEENHAAQAEAEGGAAAGDFVAEENLEHNEDDGTIPIPDGLSDGETYITVLLSHYFSSGCKAVKAGEDSAVGASPGELYITKQLLSFFSSGCKANDVEAKQGPGYSNGQIHIIKLLSSYFASGCKAAKAANDIGAMQGPGYSIGERFIITRLSSYLQSSHCKEPSGIVVVGEAGTAGRHAQSVVLELFLLIFGGCLTRIEL